MRAFAATKDLSLENPAYERWARVFTFETYTSDVGGGDITVNSVLGGLSRRGRAIVTSRQEGVVAGIREASWFLRKVGVDVDVSIDDGEHVNSGETLMSLEGSAELLLETERTHLNLVQRMSGIATRTAHLIDLVKGADNDCAIAATRKTPWPMLDKRAVVLGGGVSHRLGLGDAILIKENHLAELVSQGVQKPITEALLRAWRAREQVRFIEVETTTRKEVLEAARCIYSLRDGTNTIPCIIMLDNFSPPEATAIISELEHEGLRESVLLEGSGNITESNILEHVTTGVDVVSLGALTHSPRALDIHQLNKGCDE
jgi:nicotinate-nucleotide pyrophosphorylase (carboxylating)